MAVIRLDLAYDGSGFRGYARQQGRRTVQGELESALERVLGRPVETSVAGRTDAGVHARGQVVSFPYDSDLDPEKLLRSLNGMVGPEIAVTAVSHEEVGFNARFSAKWRSYRYLIDPRPVPDPLTRHNAWRVGRSLDLEAMRAATRPLVGEHDFTAFCRSVEDRSNVRRVEEAAWHVSDPFHEFRIRANAFCHQMVRSVVGYLYDVGRGFFSPEKTKEVIEARDRSALATIAPPHGLTLWEVGY